MLEVQCEFQVDWSECDPATIVYNPNFYDWMERSINQLLDAAGTGIDKVLATDPDFRGVPLVKASADFHAPARFGDVLVRTCRIARLGRSSLDLEHRFFLGDTLIVEARQTRVWSGVDPDDRSRIRSRPIPDDVKSAFEADRVVRIRSITEG
ncbi:acyl-CoA thioesterase [Amorphus orientalis]|uniref:4-hydroxybenzoyl-CoA thioesterase n=1 Tax=Amorphus orientalis TaxID=649198 RepID=A0AAE3VNH4_9HYPH|nr:thioesterase family protein [Amorphus orientalis]MDQ0315334.1 4-hydroxybenzoyl-CoA thioesterase [Amorphus orientalis]